MPKKNNEDILCKHWWFCFYLHQPLYCSYQPVTHLWKSRSPLGSRLTCGFWVSSRAFLNQVTCAGGRLCGGLQMRVTESPACAVVLMGCCMKLHSISAEGVTTTYSNNQCSLWLRRPRLPACWKKCLLCTCCLEISWLWLHWGLRTSRFTVVEALIFLRHFAERKSLQSGQPS